MSQYVTLIGAETVDRAGHNMRDAAQTISYAARQISEDIGRLIRALDEHAERIERAMQGTTP